MFNFQIVDHTEMEAWKLTCSLLPVNKSADSFLPFNTLFDVATRGFVLVRAENDLFFTPLNFTIKPERMRIVIWARSQVKAINVKLDG